MTIADNDVFIGKTDISQQQSNSIQLKGIIKFNNR